MPLIRKHPRRDGEINLDGIRNIVDEDRMAAQADFVRAKWGFQMLSAKKSKRATVGIPVVNQVCLLPFFLDLFFLLVCVPPKSSALPSCRARL